MLAPVQELVNPRSYGFHGVLRTGQGGSHGDGHGQRLAPLREGRVFHETAETLGGHLQFPKLLQMAQEAETNPLVVDVLEEILRAGPPQDFLAAIAGDGFGGPVPIGDAPVGIDEINPVTEII